ncbi:hypothetical protein M378DRAFT_180376 [Amanita muscaria Koide BX008]|uniref:Myb/SANT-like domain-containing protein n=1 Tax=Amanita muscaria (strain Koide BX008) TaxID=946122 RepID=A0A0C2T2F6_AMAMK|nr:hypothetical protein M378DRAFT_180376 [Amanita muscaria Koide BX008]
MAQSKRNRTAWDTPQELRMIALLTSVKSTADDGAATFKKPQLTQVADALNKEFTQLGAPKTSLNVQTKWNKIRSEYAAMLIWPSGSGMEQDAFDWTSGRPILTDERIKQAFDQFCKERPESGKVLLKALKGDWPYWEAMRNFGDISYATGEQAFEGSSAPAIGAQLSAVLGDSSPSHDPSPPSLTVAPLSSSTHPSTAATSLTAVAVHKLQKATDNNSDYNMDSDNDLPESVLSPNLPQSAGLTSAASTSRSPTAPTTSSGIGPVRPPGPNVRAEPYSRWPARSMSSRSNTSDRLKASGKLSETAMITMVGNDIRYAVDQLHTTAVTAFSKPVPAGTIIQQNQDSFPDSIVLAAMSYFSEAENAGKAKMYETALPQYCRSFVLQELRRAGIPVDQMLAEAANEVGPADEANRV